LRFVWYARDADLKVPTHQELWDLQVDRHICLGGCDPDPEYLRKVQEQERIDSQKAKKDASPPKP
jgi:hypothetical protein